MQETAAITADGTTTNPIDHSMLVSEINQRYPQCQRVFEKYGIAGCGGQEGPPEPLFIFAAAHRVPLPQLVKELNQAVRGEWRDEPRSESKAVAEAREQYASENLYKWFVAAALLVALTMGFTLGVVNITRIALDQSYYAIGGAIKQAHGHSQLFGWLGLFIMGVAFHAVPRFKTVALRPIRAAQACLGLMLTGVLLRAVAQPLAHHWIWSTAMLVSGTLELAAIGLFVWLIARVVFASEQTHDWYEKYVYAGVAWLAVLGVWNFWLTTQMFAHRTIGVPALANALFIHAALFGFASNMIFGFSLRVLPHFLGLREARKWPGNLAFVCWNAAIFLRYPDDTLAWIASILELLAVILFVWSLGVFTKRRVDIQIHGVDGSFARFIYLGYGWLLMAALVPFRADVFRLSASARHTMTVGFITSIMFGVAYRVLPIFNGVNLWSHRLMRASFWALAAGSTIAFAMAFSVVFPGPWTFAWVATAGWLVLIALVMFTVNIAMTLQIKAEKFTRKAPVTLRTRVAELLEVYPELRPVLIHNGLSGLAAMRHDPPRFVTIEFAARRHGIDPQPLIKLLNDETERQKTTLATNGHE